MLIETFAFSDELPLLCKLPPRCGSTFSDDDPSGDEIIVDDEADEMSIKVARAINNAKASKALDSKKLGNQKRRLNDLLETLSKNSADNLHLIAEITAHKAIIQLCEESAIKMLPGLSSDQFLLNMNKLKEAKVKMSSDYKAAVFTKSITNLLATTGTNQTDHLDPIFAQMDLHTCTATDFDPAAPTLSALDYSSAQKFRLFQKYVMERVFIPLLGKGAAGAVVATAVSRKLSDSFENMSEDIELSDTSSAIVMDCITIWRCVIAVSSDLDGESSLEDMETYSSAVRSVHESSQVAGSRNIKAMVGRILQTSEYWQEKVQSFLETRAAWKDLRPKVNTTKETLAASEPGNPATNELLVRASDLHLLATEKLRHSAYESLTDMLLTATRAHVSAVISALPDPQRQANIKAVSAALQSVSLALPQEPDIVAMACDLAAELRNSDEENKIAVFTACATQVLAIEKPSEWDDASHDICKCLDTCQGLPASMVNDLCQKAYKCATSALAASFDADGYLGADGARMIAESLTNYIHDIPLVKTVLDCFGQVRNMYLLMQKKKAVVNDKFSFTGTQTPISLSDFEAFQGYLTKSKNHVATMRKEDCAIADIMKDLFNVCVSKIEECEQVSDAGVQHYKLQKTVLLEASTKELKLAAGGAANGADWAENLPQDCGWEVFETECKQTLLANDYLGSQLPAMRKKLLKDRANIGLFTGP